MNSATRNFLRKRAHEMKPIVMVGKQGGDDRVSRALDEALTSHELLKVRFQDFQDEIRPIAESLAEGVGAEIVSVVGHVVIMFRQNEKPEDRHIHIPKLVSSR
ncbi:MAG: YhbY family RNA-binding protein [Sphaerochaetaceae bacterium]|nr:YhbY family RNA-binding protein [Sphaerochaetaceae bacterium]MDD3942616.1 YhbY family RNA-binding protein [Sphaerochaetaceae bacterium]MDX9938464.1 YhbY family RNA-binding protein [Sphaerochaetaceae bacterium]